jgi:hypothetical protein
MSGAGRIPKVSVLTTLYNKGPYVEEAVRSVLAQDLTDLELLVVDDASTDGGPEKVKALGDPRIRVLESPVNTGRAAAANRGYDAARGQYVAVLDADDRMLPGRLSKQVAWMEARPEVVACGAWATLQGGSGPGTRMPADDAGCRAVMLFGMPVLYPAAMLRRSVLEAHALRCDAQWKLPGMDYLFLLQLGRHGAYANLQEPLFAYRQGENNMRHGRNERSDRLLLTQAAFRFFGLEAGQEELELHMGLHGLWRQPVTAADVRGLWRWKQKLARQNRERGLFPAAAFEAELERRWRQQFHRLADQGTAPALAHLRLGGPWTLNRMGYLAKTTVNRWTGRRQ